MCDDCEGPCHAGTAAISSLSGCRVSSRSLRDRFCRWRRENLRSASKLKPQLQESPLTPASTNSHIFSPRSRAKGIRVKDSGHVPLVNVHSETTSEGSRTERDVMLAHSQKLLAQDAVTLQKHATFSVVFSEATTEEGVTTAAQEADSECAKDPPDSTSHSIQYPSLPLEPSTTICTPPPLQIKGPRCYPDKEGGTPQLSRAERVVARRQRVEAAPDLPTYPLSRRNESAPVDHDDLASLRNMDRLLDDAILRYPHYFSVGHPDRSVFEGWDLISLLGSGTFASVYRVRHSRSGVVCAAKVLSPQRFSRPSRMRISEMFANEIKYSILCQCPGVVRIRKVVRGSEGYVIFQDLIEGGTLWENSKFEDEDQRFSVFIQLLQTLLLFQQRLTVHRDLKPTNILRAAGDGSVLIADFGWSEHFSHLDDHLNELPGTVEINPPEVLSHVKPQTEKIDNYALGLNLLLITSQHFVCRNRKVRRISDAARKVLERIAIIRKGGMLPGFTKPSWEVFQGLTEFNAAHRVSLMQVLRSEWVCMSLAKYASSTAVHGGDERSQSTFVVRVGTDKGLHQVLWLPIVRRVALAAYTSVARQLLVNAVRNSVLSEDYGMQRLCQLRKAQDESSQPQFDGAARGIGAPKLQSQKTSLGGMSYTEVENRGHFSEYCSSPDEDLHVVMKHESWPKARALDTSAKRLSATFSDTSTTGGCITDIEGSTVCSPDWDWRARESQERLRHEAPPIWGGVNTAADG